MDDDNNDDDKGKAPAGKMQESAALVLCFQLYGVA